MAFLSTAIRSASALTGRVASTGLQTGGVAASSIEGVGVQAGNASANFSKLAAQLSETGKAANDTSLSLVNAKSEYGMMTGMIQGVFKDIFEAPILPAKMALDQLKQLSSQYTSLFSPQTVRLLDMAFRDFNAVIGEMLMPVVKAGTEVVRFLGDALANVTPALKGLLTALIEGIRPVWQMVGEVIKEAAPILTMLLTELRAPLMEFLKTMGGFTKEFLTILTTMLRGLKAFLAAIGIATPDFQENAGRGKAFVSATQTNASSVLTRLQTNAFGVSGGKEEPMVQLNQSVISLAVIMKNLPKEFADALATVINGSKNEATVNTVLPLAAGVMNLRNKANDVLSGRNPFN